MFTSRGRIHLACLFALCFLALGYAHRAGAQVLYGSVTGTVTDQTGAAVPKAHVVVTNRATGVARGADADDTGHYVIIDVSPGNYDLTVKVSGFKPLTQTGLTIRTRSEEHTSELQSPCNLVCRLLLEKKKKKKSESSDPDVRH